MKKYILLIVGVFLITGCQKNNVTFEKGIIEEKKEEIKDIYQDHNPMPIGIYDSNDKEHYIIEGSYSQSFEAKKDINTFAIYPSSKKSLNHYSKPKEFFRDLWVQIDPEHHIQMGFNIDYYLKDDTHINYNIFKPSDMKKYYDYLEIYLYDAYAHRNDSWYSHVEDTTFTKDTYYTSIKLTAGSKIDDISSPITLKVFTFDTEDDFDEKGNYKGRSYYQISICNKGVTCK
ncbi:MAG: lipoprotein [Mollicutes bacterium]|nr:lipoprotein [Mollicutes bacterium]